MAPLSEEHQLNRLVFDDIEYFMSRQEVPPVQVSSQPRPVPFIATVGDIEVAFIALFRRSGPSQIVAIVIQYSVRVAGATVASMIRSSHNPIYGLMHWRPQVAEDLAHLKSHVTAPLIYRPMTEEEIPKFAVDLAGLTKKQIRIVPHERPAAPKP